MARTIHRTTPVVESEHSTARVRPIELQTENGFSIVRRCDLDGRGSMRGTEHCFVAQDPNKSELDITVAFSGAARAEVARRSYGRIDCDSSFWINCAERHLADYLLENDDYPPGGRITVEFLTLNDVDSVQRWETEKPVAEGSFSKIKAAIPFRNGNGSAVPAKAEAITFVTENGYQIVRACDLDHSIYDLPEQCHFRVTDTGGRQRAVTVRFEKIVVDQLQARRRRGPLAPASKYWPVIAEKHLADYLWRHNEFPPNGELMIDQIPGDDLLLGVHWHDGNQIYEPPPEAVEVHY